jgi:hypothetical protein
MVICWLARSGFLLQLCRGRHTSLRYRFGYRAGAKEKGVRGCEAPLRNLKTRKSTRRRLRRADPPRSDVQIA